jgi:serine/threonine protein kinase
VHGENLRRLLTKVARAREVVPLDQVITIVLAVAAGLHYAHQQSIVHRDVTPANILIGYDGNVKVMDFGIAKAMLQSSELTKSGTMRGKVAYMAPEQCLGRPIDRRSDIFALVLYELCVRRLFKGDTDFLVMTSIVNGKIEAGRIARTAVDLEDVIRRRSHLPEPVRDRRTRHGARQVAANHGIRVSPSALAEYMTKLFGTRPEPWLVDAKLETVDVDFDGTGTGLVELDDEPSNAAIERELLESPILAAASANHAHDRNEFSEDLRTEIEDHDDEPPTLTGSMSPATSGFEGNEKTLIGDEADVDMLVNMSRIEGRRDATPVPRRDTTPVPRRDATPVPRRDATPVPRPDATPPPRAQTPPPHAPPPPPRDATPIPRDATPIPRDAAPALVRPSNQSGQSPAVVDQTGGRPQWASSPSGTGTPMAWAPQDSEIISLAPKGRRFMLIAAVSVPLSCSASS